MKIRKTSKVDSHHTNPNYVCLVVEWNGDVNFRCRNGDVHDWMPTDKEMLELFLEWIQISPTAWPLILDHVKPAEYVHEFV